MATSDLDAEAPLVGTMTVGALERVSARASGASPPVPLPWGSVASALRGGLWPGLHVLAGAPGTGKTQLTVQVAAHAAQQGTPVLYVSLELSQDEMVVRLVGAVAEVPWSDALTGDADAARRLEAGRVSKGFDTLPLRLWVPDRSLTVDRLRAHVAELVTLDGRPTRGRTPPLVVVDYLQRLRVRKAAAPREDARQRVGHAAYGVRDLARDLQVAVLVVSSVARSTYGGGSGARTHATDHLAVGKESGDVEYSADTVATLVVDHRGGAPGMRALLHLAKVRHGVPSTCDLGFDGTRFSDRAKLR